MNSCSAPVSYALEGNNFYITENGFEGLLNGSDDDYDVFVDSDEMSPYIVSEMALYGGALVVATIIASSYSNMTPATFQNISFNVWNSSLSISARNYFTDLCNGYQEGKALKIRKDMVNEILNSVNDYVSETKGNIIYDSTVNGLPLKTFKNGIDVFEGYDSSLIFYSLGSSITINENYNLSANISEDGKLKMLVNGFEPYMYDDYVIDEEKSIVMSINDNRMNNIRPLVGSEVFYIQFVNMTNNREGFALCYSHEGSVYVYGSATLSVSPNSSVLTAPGSSIKNEDLLAGSGSISLTVPHAYEDLVSNNKVNSSVMTDTETGSIVNTTEVSSGGSGGSGGVSLNFNPLMNLGSGLKKVFPFCLPFDLYDIISIFEAEPLTPVLNVDLSFIPLLKNSDVVFTVDFSVFNGLMKLVRVVEYISFCICLILVTRRLL